MKIDEFKKINKEDLAGFIDKQRSRGLKIRFDIASKQVKNHREYRSIRKNIARALTFLKEK